MANKNNGWIGVDLDGTLARYDEWEGSTQIGEPIVIIVQKVKAALKAGYTVKIFTARISEVPNEDIYQAIYMWCSEHLGIVLPVTNMKDYSLIELWDDRAIRVSKNEGIACTPGSHGDSVWSQL